MSDTTPEQQFSLYRLCTCVECGGSGKDPTVPDIDAGRVATPRCPECRGEGRIRQELAGADSPEAVGVALVTLAREGEWIDADGNPCQFGLLDRTPECPECEGRGKGHFPEDGLERGDHVSCPHCKGSGMKPTGTWLILPFPTTARTASAAGRLLQTRRAK